MRDNYLGRIRVIIQEPVLHNDSPPMVMAKQMYTACINEDSGQNGVQLIKDTMNQIGGWAVLDNDWNGENFDWKKATYELRQLGFPYEYFVQVAVRENKEDSSKYILQIGSPLSVLSMETDEQVEIFYNHMVDIAVAFGANQTTAEEDYKDVINFLKNLLAIANSSWDDDITKDYFTLPDVQRKFPDIPWIEYISHILNPVKNVNMDTLIQVTEIPYIFYLGNVLSTTSKRCISNYMAWRMIIEHSSTLTSEIGEITQNFYKRLNKQMILPIPSITKACSGSVESIFSLPIQAEYVNRFVSKDAKDDVTEMIDNIIEDFKDEIDDLDWMDYETRRTAISRISNISIYVAYPDEMLDADKINGLYEGYKIQEDNLLASLISVNYRKVNLNFQKLHEPEDEDTSNFEVNKKYTTYGMVYYLSSDNSITVPHRVLQHIIYNEDRPKYLNYGGLGTFIAHQLFHAIFEGSSIRQESDYYSWLPEEVKEVYQTKLNCVAQQYQNFYVPELKKHVNSSNTKNEDIADIAGIQLAYKAYRKWVHLYGKESRLPRLDYTPKQMFWISSAIRYCSKGSHEAIDKAVTYSYQSLKRFRVLGALKNSKEFARDFHCPLDSTMNPKDKCDFW
ncbi:hypothetical protein FQR65_LT03336 [Abscondita terminalis]|nr:hypothetical protein FQR65_LT03336 [Abscondita terminalis]